ncbi:hypothetical protein EDD85DRAFT_222658 [Armillaria nabsnona]|nr:hypothetical protein EDD85DRAFT_222658 [Armillaria nabsnona]
MKTFVTLVKKKGVETAIPPLQGLKAVAELASIPVLGPATDIILSILEIVYQSQQNAGTCREIANRCLRALVTLSQHLESVQITERLLKSIRQLKRICMTSKNSSKSIDTRRRSIVSFIRNQTMMNCNALENGLMILCHFFKSRIYFRLMKSV